MTKILAESLREFKDINTPTKEDLNESAKQLLAKFLNDPDSEKGGLRFKKAFQEQAKKLSKIHLDVNALIDSMDVETKKRIAQQAIDKIKANPSQDRPQLPVVKTKEGVLKIKKDAEVTGSGLAGRSGIHGGTKN